MPRSERFLFIASFTLSCIGFYTLVHFLPPWMTAPANEDTASKLGLVLNAWNISAKAANDTVSEGMLAFQIIPDCTPIFTIGLFLCFVAFYPAATLRQKGMGLLMGFPALYLGNLARLAATFALSRHDRRLFDPVHVYLGQIFTIFLVILVVVSWLRWTDRKEPDQGLTTKMGGFLGRFALFSGCLFLLWIQIHHGYIWLIDRAMTVGLSFFNWHLIIPRDASVYYETFNVVTFASLVLATGSIKWPTKLTWLTGGLAILFIFHLVHRIDNLLVTGFASVRAIRVDYIVCDIGQYVIPFVLWLMMLRWSTRKPGPLPDRAATARDRGAFRTIKKVTGHKAIVLLLALSSPLSPPASHAALLPDQILVVANRSFPESIQLARYYMKRRGIPEQYLIQIETTTSEHISRKGYEKEIAEPVRDFLIRKYLKGKEFACIVLMYGIPLRVEAPLLETGRNLARKLEDGQIKSQKQAKERAGKKVTQDAKGQQERMKISEMSEGASVDSELALVRNKKYALAGWIPNPYFAGFRGKQVENMPRNVLVVSRLDGPSGAVVRRIIDDSVEAETRGLVGTAYFDARWPDKGNSSQLSAYQQYDRAIHSTARIVEKSRKLPVVLDEQERLFQSKEAPNAALYCGWYSLGKYIDAFTWARGAVGFHVASSESTTLKAPGSTVWVKSMLEKGVAATVGPVAEPYLQSFPQPEVLFACLLDGHQLAECYAVSNPFWSWQQVLVGDPLYRPFKAAHQGLGESPFLKNS